MHIHKSNNTRRKTVKLTAVAERPLPVKHAGRRRRGEAPLGVGILMTPGWFAKARKWPEYAIGLRQRVYLDGGEISAKDLDPDDVKILAWLFEKRTGLACRIEDKTNKHGNPGARVARRQTCQKKEEGQE